MPKPTPRLRYCTYLGLPRNRLRNVCSMGNDLFTEIMQDLRRGDIARTRIPKRRQYSVFRTHRETLDLPDGRAVPAMRVVRAIAQDRFYVVLGRKRLHIFLKHSSGSPTEKVGEFY